MYVLDYVSIFLYVHTLPHIWHSHSFYEGERKEEGGDRERNTWEIYQMSTFHVMSLSHFLIKYVLVGQFWKCVRSRFKDGDNYPCREYITKPLQVRPLLRSLDDSKSTLTGQCTSQLPV